MSHAERRTIILDRLADGQSLAMIARRVGLSRASISMLAQRHGGAHTLRRAAGLLYAVDVARLLGIGERTARRWAAEGLYRTRLQRLDDRVFRVTNRRALLACVRERQHFMRLTVDRIADPVLRAVAQQARATAGGHWATTQEIGAALGYASAYVAEWFGDGRWTGEVVRVGLYWYGWVPDGTTLRELMR